MILGNCPKEFDQFFTLPSVARECVGIVENIVGLRFDRIVEPSFGEGAFVDALINDYHVARGIVYYVDIDAEDAAHRKDFLLERLDNDDNARCLTIGNPPFGKNSSLAIAFFNHAAKFSDVIAFILPRTFLKPSVQNRLDRSFFLIHETSLPPNSFLYEGERYDVPTIFQIWRRDKKRQRPMITLETSTPDFRFVKANENPDIAIRRVGVNAGRIFDESPNLCNANSHLFLKFADAARRERVLGVLKRLELERTPCKFNTAGCPSISKRELCKLYSSAIHE